MTIIMFVVGMLGAIAFGLLEMHRRRSSTCGCTPDVPCLRHVVVRSDQVMGSTAAVAFGTSQIHGEIDMAGPESHDAINAHANHK